MHLVSLACLASAQIAVTVALPGQAAFSNAGALEARSPGIRQRKAMTRAKVATQNYVDYQAERRAAAKQSIADALAAGQAAARAAVSGGVPNANYDLSYCKADPLADPALTKIWSTSPSGSTPMSRAFQPSTGYRPLRIGDRCHLTAATANRGLDLSCLANGESFIPGFSVHCEPCQLTKHVNSPKNR